MSSAVPESPDAAIVLSVDYYKSLKPRPPDLTQPVLPRPCKAERGTPRITEATGPTSPVRRPGLATVKVTAGGTTAAPAIPDFVRFLDEIYATSRPKKRVDGSPGDGQ